MESSLSGRKRPLDEVVRAGGSDAAPAAAEEGRGGSDVIELDARDFEGLAWAHHAVDAFNAAHAATGVWPAAVHVRNVTYPAAFAALTHERIWNILADRCGGDTRIRVHDLDAPPSKRELGMTLSTWAALRARRAGASAPADEAPPAPRGVAKAHWAALLAGEHALYMSAFEMPTHAPEVATAFNAIAGAVCMLRHVPGAHENVGPIVMDADAGASSGWHRDGTRLRGEAFRGGDVNAFHAHLSGAKRWLLYPPRVTDAVSSAMQHAPKNAFGNLIMSQAVADSLAQAGVVPTTLESRGGDVVLLGKQVWHNVDTTQASVSLASDRLFTDQLGALGATMRCFDGRPLMPAKWAVREAAASLSSAVMHGVRPASGAAVARSILTECAAFLEAHMASEPAVVSESVFNAAPPACVSCDRPHAPLRYCHGCCAELFNAFFECAEEDCPWEACGACHAASRAAGRNTCTHVSARPHFLHHTPEANERLLQQVHDAIGRLAAAAD